MEIFIEQIRNYFNVSDKSIKMLFEKMTEVALEKNKVFISEGDSNKYVFFVKEGLTRSYIHRDGKDFTSWFSKAGEPVVMTMGMIAPQKSVICAETLQKSVLLRINRNDLEDLFTSNLELCNWGRRLADTFLCELETVLTRELCSSANERYQYLLKEDPDILQQVPLKYVASYLMITPESLSRIRRNLGK